MLNLNLRHKILVIFVTSCLCLLCSFGFQQATNMFHEPLMTNPLISEPNTSLQSFGSICGYPFINYPELEGDPENKLLVDSLKSCYSQSKDFICAYEYGDTYYFQLTSEKFSNRDFKKPYYYAQGNQLVIQLYDTTLVRENYNSECMTFYAKKSNVGNLNSIILKYSLFDAEEYKLLGRQEINIVPEKLK